MERQLSRSPRISSRGARGSPGGRARLTEQAVILSIEYEGNLATGLLPVPADLVERVAVLLRAHTGRPISEIGGLEVPD